MSANSICKCGSDSGHTGKGNKEETVEQGNRNSNICYTSRFCGEILVLSFWFTIECDQHCPRNIEPFGHRARHFSIELERLSSESLQFPSYPFSGEKEEREKKRQQLAAMPTPYPDFPFPGYVATDRLHWLRAEFTAAGTDANKLRLATELLRRAEAIGDKAEAVGWRVETNRLSPAVPPPPRVVK